MSKTTLKPWPGRWISRWSGRPAAALAALALVLLSRADLQAQATVATLGGGSTKAPYYGYVDGNTLTAAKFNAPAGLALDPSGTVLFVADSANNAIRVVSQIGSTASSVTSTFLNATNHAGGAGLIHPVAVAVDAATNVYVLCQGAGGNGSVLHLGGISMNSGLVEVFPALASGLANPTAMTQDGFGNLYVTVNGNQVIRVTTNGVVTTLATVGQSGVALQGIAMLDNGLLAVTDSGNNGIWTVNPVTGVSTKFTGFHGAADVLGGATLAAFNGPGNLCKAGNGILVVADRGNNKYKLVDAAGSVTLLYGVSSNLWVVGQGTFPGWRDGPGATTSGAAESRLPTGMVVGTDGSVYTSEDYYHVLRHVTATGLTAPGQSYPQVFWSPAGIALDPSGNALYIADTANNTVDQLNFNANQTSQFVGGANGVSHPTAVLVATNGNVYVLNQNAGTNGCLLQFDPYGNLLGTNLAGLNQPTALTMDGAGNLFITELTGRVKVLFPSGAANTIVAITTNVATLKTNVQLQGIAVFDDGMLAVSDSGNQVIWTVNPITKLVSKLTGQIGVNGSTLGASNFALLSQPHQLARAGNNQLVVADYGNSRLVTVTRAGAITNVLASANSSIWLGRPTDPAAGASVAMTTPVGVAVNGSGQVFDSEPANGLLRRLNATLAAPPAPAPIVNLPLFANPQGLAFDGADNFLFIADTPNNAIQLLDLNDNTTTTFLNQANGVLNPSSVLLDTNDNVYVLNQGTPGNGFILEFDIYGNEYGAIVTGLNQPTAFTLDGNGTLFVAEQAGNIRAFGAGPASLVATITNANVSLQGIALFDDGSIAVSDAGNQVIWTINPITKAVTKLTGKLGVSGAAVGAANFAQLSQPHQLVRVGGNQLVAADYGNNRLVLVQRNGTVVTNNATYHLNSSIGQIWFGQAGDPFASGSPKFLPMVWPGGVTLGTGGEIFTSEGYYDDIRGLTGTGISSPSFNPGVPLPYYGNPAGIGLNSEGTVLYVTDPTNNTVSALNLLNNQTTVLLNAASGIDQPVDVACDSEDNIYVLNQGGGGNGSVLEFDQFGNFLATKAAALTLPTAMKLDFSANLFVAEQNGLVQEFNAAGSNTLANITTNANVRLEGIAVLDNGAVVVSDAGNQVLWKIPAGANNTNAVLFTGVLGVRGTNFGGVGAAKLNQPMRLARALGGLLLIADAGNNRVVVADDAGTVSRALNSTNATLWFGLPIDPVSSTSPYFLPMLTPVGLAIGSGTGSNGVVYTSEAVYKDIRGIVVQGIYPPVPPPPAPLNLVATVTFGQVTLTWSAALGATNYYVLHANSSGGPYTVVGTTAATLFTDNELGGSTNYYVVAAVNAGGTSPYSAEVSAVPLIAPPPAPIIGWFDYEPASFPLTVIYPVAIATFNNDQLLAIDPVTNFVSTYYTTDGSTPSATNGSTPPLYKNGLGYAQPLPASITPTLTLKAINIDAVGQASPVTTAQFLFQVANPTIIGNNAGQFLVTDLTTNAQLFYTVDGSDPAFPTNGTTSYGPVTLNSSNAAVLSLRISSNTLFKVRGYRPGYSPSGIAQQSFSTSNFVANTISFGFASGEASSTFIASPGQRFYAPVTLGVLPATQIYSLQFDVTVTNAGPNPGPAVTPGAFSFQSMLMKPNTLAPGTFVAIPPYMFVGDDTAPLNPSQIVNYNGTNFVDLLFTNSALNLLGVGWLERYSETNLYPTVAQDLINFSLAHDDLFTQAKGQVILGGYSFVVPASAASNQTYQLQIIRPSATSDGIGTPGSDVYIAAPTNASAAGDALQYVTVGQIKYLAGSVYPFRWFNAGDFGSSNIVNADVEQVFQSAIYSLNYPLAGSDFFDAMDSCGGTYVDLGNGYLEFNTLISGPSSTSPLFGGDDTSINQIAFGDGVLDVCDVYVTFRRSLDPGLTWFERYWDHGQRVAVAVPNVASHAVKAPASGPPPTSKALNTAAEAPRVNFTAGDFVGSAGQTVTLPINASIVGNYPLRVLMLNLSVVPLDGSPAITTPISFNQIAAPLGAPYTTTADGSGNFAAVWLNSTNGGLTGAVTLGTLTVTIPATAGATAAYAIHFDHASASPNGLASFANSALTGLLTTSARTNSTYGDGIPDSWRLRWFGTVNNLLSASNACPSGDGVPNWRKFIAGVDPNVANDFPSLNSKTPVPSGSTTALHWPSVYNKQYVIQRANSVFGSPWTVLSTNTGTGGDMEYDDTNTASLKFYRVEILPGQATQ